MLIQTVAVVALAIAAAAQLPEAREALRLGRSQDEAMYDAFTKGYALAVAGPVDHAEIVTEFRRAVLIVRDRARLGEFGFTERDLNVAMTPQLGLISFVVQARLNPLHTYARPPAYELYVSTGPETPPLAGKEMRRDPVYGPGLSMGSPLVGVRLEITIPRARIEAARLPELILTDEHANILWRSRIDLSRFR